MGEIILFSILVFVFGYPLFVVFEKAYALFFHKPLYVHFYLSPKKVSLQQLEMLARMDFYKKLPPDRKHYFEHRVAVFIKNYQFYGNGDFEVTDEMKIAIASSAIMLTFGMRFYLFTNFDKIIIYPDSYHSTITDVHHNGEFNPKARVIVFSWKHFQEGIAIGDNNLNLGLHEFAHALHFQSKKVSNVSLLLFADMHQKIIADIQNPRNNKMLVESGYFRDYAFTNNYEFIAVLLEHFFETPLEFKSQFPELYTKVRKMINFDESLLYQDHLHL